ncbi:MAG: hypothetical protein H7320_04945 [Ferruginibacter sp.]|nr:hypothetical protein [Ferruginibacter sp.]
MATLKQLSVQVSFEQPPEKEIGLIGFLFFCNGLLLQQQAVRDNMLQFDFGKRTTGDKNTVINSNELRLFLAPAADKKIANVSSIEELENFKPYEAILSADANGGISILPIPSVITQFWPFCNCRVIGKVSKWFHIGNTWKDRAVCRARVHICEIDAIRYWINHIPDTIIAKIPEVILNPNEIIKFPIPIPDPPPFVRNNIQASAQQSVNIFKTVSADQQLMEAAAALPELSLDIRQTLASGNLNQIREIIVKNYVIFHPWFCLWPWWWPYFYRCTERAVVYTDANGRFDTNVSYWCFGDKPDIYIWVEYMINGVWTTVYNPPIPCYTFWDYACGSNINIHVTDPRVPGDCCCNCDLAGELVWVRSIGGNGASVVHINQSFLISQPPVGQTVPYNRIGLTDASAGGDGFFITNVGDFKRPFGSNLSFYMGFGSDLPNAGIFYYRWRYQQVNRADLSNVTGTIEYLSNLEIKKYDFEYHDINGALQVGHNSVILGPQSTVGSSNNLYIIPPPVPNMVPFNVTEANPTWFERTRNTSAISFDSSALANGNMPGGDGLYEFTLELFDQAGNLLSNIPRATFKVPDYVDPELSTNAPDQLLVNPTAATANAYKMLVRVDNSKCHSNIYPVSVDHHAATIDCCGFVSYKPNGVEAELGLSFLATHPNNFAVFDFNVVKGTCGNVVGAAARGMVIDSADGYAISVGIYDKQFTPLELLGNCYKTGKAAFAETLSVISMATDGVNRVSGNDAPCIVGLQNHCVAAFALEP